MDTSTIICEKILTLRKSKKWTQQELADKAGLSRGAINSYENFKSIPPAESIVKLAKAFGVTTDYLLGVEQEKTVPKQEPPADELENPYLSKDQMIAKLFNEIEFKNKQLQKCEEEVERLKNGRTPVYSK